ncbi:hypothetical protein [Nonomuraea typhae]|uniref:hypothetical protein n=1 Tax=Nonomuraea typhae TaxID=2603600 RepID=UPI0012FCF48A
MANQTALGFTIFARERASKVFKSVAHDIDVLEARMQKVQSTARTGVGLAAAAGGAVALTQAVLPAVAAVGAMPAVLLATKAASATLKVGLIGVGDAMSAVAEDDAAKLDEALEKLSPNARRFVREVAGLKRSFDPIQQAVQDKIFAGLANELRPVAVNLLPETRTGMLAVAGAFNTGAREVTAFGKTDLARGTVNRVFAGTSRIMGTVTGAVQPLLRTVSGLVGPSFTLAQRMAGWAVNGAKAADAFVSSERGAAMLQRGAVKAGDTLAQLGRIGGNAIKGLVGMFSQAKSTGDGLLDTLEAGTARFAAWSRSVEGQKQAAEVFGLLKDTAVAVADVLPILLGPLASVVKLINGLPEPLRNGVVQFLAFSVVIGTVTSRLRPLLAVVGTAAAAFRAADGPVSKFRENLSSASGAAGKSRVALGGFAGFLGGPWGLAITAAAAGLLIFSSRNDEAEQHVKNLTDALIANNGALDDASVKSIQSALETQGVYKAAERLGINLQKVTDAALGEKETLAELTAQLQTHATTVNAAGGRVGQFRTAQKQLTGDALLLSNAITGQNQAISDATGRYQRIVAGAPSTSAASKNVADSMSSVGSSAKDAKVQVAGLTAELAKYKNKTGDADLAGIAFRDSLDELTEAFRKNNVKIDERTGKIDINSKAGREATRVLIGSINAAVEHSKKVNDQTNSVDRANKVFATEISRLRGVLVQSGLSRAEIDKLVARYLKLPSQINGATDKIKNRRVMIEVKAGGKLVGFRVNVGGSTGTVLNATGGVMPDILPGYSPGKDNHFFYSPDGRGKIGLSGGEAVMRPEWTRAVGSGYVHTMNAIARHGGASAVAKAMGVGPRWAPRMGGEGVGYASGGIIAKHSISGLSSVQAMAAKANALYGSWASQMGKAVSGAYNKVWLGGPGVQNALTWARAQAGKPYIWGGVGPYGYDCSGFTSAITNVIQGRSPYSRRHTTHSFGTRGGPDGFIRNRQSGFMVGVTDAGVGHMAGTLGGTNVESRGSRGVVVGPAARGASNDLFSRRYGLKFDDGGMLPPEWSMVYNGTGAPEPLANVDKMRGGDLIIQNAHFHGVQDVADFVQKLQRYAKDRGGIALKIRG